MAPVGGARLIFSCPNNAETYLPSFPYLSLLTDWGGARLFCQVGDKVMKTTQAWGWLAAGVLALGLNGIYQDGGAAWMRRNVDGVIARIADRSGAVLALAAGRADWFAAKANLLGVRNETASCRVASAVARFQTKIARTQGGLAEFEAMAAREEAALARLEANRARIEAQVARVRFSPVAFDAARIPVICPRVRVNTPRMPVVKIPAPVVNFGSSGGGPI
jgi:hypothetical protein